MRIIPAIDVVNGKCVRLTQGDYNTIKVYHNNPLDQAKAFEDSGIKYLHLVDLDGAKAKHSVNYKVLETIATKTNLMVDFGGGVKSDEDVKIAFSSGAKQITVGSIALEKPELMLAWLKQYGPEKIILGADSNYGKIATQGWTNQSSQEIIPFIKSYEAKGLKYTIVTDIQKDGMLQGPSFALYQDILLQSSLQLIASGGVFTIEDVYQLKAIGCEAVIIGKAIYEGAITLKDLESLC